MNHSNHEDVRAWMECDCENVEHSVRITLYDYGGTDLELYLEPQVRFHISFFRRVWTALRYILKLDEGTFTSVHLSEKGVDELSKIIVSYRLIKKLRIAKRKV